MDVIYRRNMESVNMVGILLKLKFNTVLVQESLKIGQKQSKVENSRSLKNNNKNYIIHKIYKIKKNYLIKLRC